MLLVYLKRFFGIIGKKKFNFIIKNKNEYKKLYKYIRLSKEQRFEYEFDVISNLDKTFFDSDWYLSQYSDVRIAGINPIEHWINYGAIELRDPSPTFSTSFYVSHNEAIKLFKLNPLVHCHILQLNEYINKANIIDTIPNPNNNIDFVPDEVFIKSRTNYLDYNDMDFKKYINSLSSSKKESVQRKNYLVDEKLKFAIYSAVSNDYDTIKVPLVNYDNCDLVIFSDTPIEKVNNCIIKPIEYLDSDYTRRCRYIKTHPHYLLPNYDYVIWLDMNIAITDSIEDDLINFIESGKLVGFVHHPLRNNIYDEALACINLGKDDKNIISEQMNFLKAENFISNELIESNYMILNNKSNVVHNFLNDWWLQIFLYSKREQLSLNYVLKKNSLDWCQLHNLTTTARNHPSLAFTCHNKGVGKSKIVLDTLTDTCIKPYSGSSFFDVKNKLLDEVKTSTVDIVICVYNALEVLKKCLDSVCKYRNVNNHRIIIINDGSTEEVCDYLKDFSNKTENCQYIYNKTSIGYTKSANLGLKESNADLVVLLNSDTIVTKDWLYKFSYIQKTKPNVGIISPLSNAASYQSIPSIKSGKDNTAINKLPFKVTVDEMNEYCEKWSVANVYPFVEFVHGFCYAITRNCIDKIGYFDEENFPIGYGEEDDYSLRAIKAGFTNIIDTTTYIYHEKSQSFIGEKRVKLMQNGAINLHTKHKKRIVEHCGESLTKNCLLDKFRVLAQNLYEVQNSQKPLFHMIVSITKEEIPAGSGYVRCILPWTNSFIQSNFNISISYKSNNRLPILDNKMNIKGGICLIQRDCIGIDNDVLENWGKHWHSLGGKIIYDLDDDFFETESLSEKAQIISYTEAFSLTIRTKFLISLSDLIIVSTNNLKNKILAFNNDKKVIIIKNVLDDYIWNFKFDNENNKHHDIVKIGYIGTPSHIEDMNMIKEAIQDVKNKYGSSVTFEVIGVGNQNTIPWGNIIETKNSSYPNFSMWLQSIIDWDIGLIPLSINEFNLSKSNLKFLEYSALELSIIVSNIDTYSDIAKDGKNCIIANNTKEDWYNAICKLIENQKLRKELAKNAKIDVYNNFILSKNIDMYKNALSLLLEE